VCGHGYIFENFLNLSNLTYTWTSFIRDIMPLLLLFVGPSSECRLHFPDIIKTVGNKVKVKVALEQAPKSQRGSRGIALLFL
jgi:hypothetical protein